MVYILSRMAELDVITTNEIEYCWDVLTFIFILDLNLWSFRKILTYILIWDWPQYKFICWPWSICPAWTTRTHLPGSEAENSQDTRLMGRSMGLWTQTRKFAREELPPPQPQVDRRIFYDRPLQAASIGRLAGTGWTGLLVAGGRLCMWAEF